MIKFNLEGYLIVSRQDLDKSISHTRENIILYNFCNK